MHLSRYLFFAGLLFVLFLSAFRYDGNDGPKPVSIPPSAQRDGDPAKGYEYLVTGNYLRSGFPLDFFVKLKGRGSNLLGRTGKNAEVNEGYNVVPYKDSLDIVIPTCLQCHSGIFEGKLVVGLGNSSADFTEIGKKNGRLRLLKQWKLTRPLRYEALEPLLTSMLTADPLIETEVRGVNPANRLAAVLVAHRDPTTLAWSDSELLPLPNEVVPTDVPAWWLLKKKNAMFYTGFGRGDFTRFLMLSNILTVRDTGEARDVFHHFNDVLAYIRSIQPPPYPKTINQALAGKGRAVFNHTCSGCHGLYEPGGTYPNLLVPGAIVQTDSLLFRSNQQAEPFVNWFNNSWFAKEPFAARLVPGNGYVAPPLDGVWITAPYLHNGSVPTLEGVLNSKVRPVYWTRDFENPQYDYDKVGWKYEARTGPDGRKVYNTTLPGYGNYGHYFGDKLTSDEREAVIEYLKTL